MLGHAGGSPPQRAMHFWNAGSRDYDAVAYGELVQRAVAFGGRLVEADRGAGSVCMIGCHSPYAALVAFYGAVSVGAIPMIFPMPRALGSHEALVERIRHWGARFDTPPSLVIEEGLTEKFHAEIPDGICVIRLGDSPTSDRDRLSLPAADHDPRPDDVAFFQTTSSSRNLSTPLFPNAAASLAIRKGETCP